MVSGQAKPAIIALLSPAACRPLHALLQAVWGSPRGQYSPLKRASLNLGKNRANLATSRILFNLTALFLSISSPSDAVRAECVGP